MWVPVASNNYRETISYDANGNIQKYNRYANPAIMDSLTYTYKAGKNQLDYIDDKVADATFTVDIDKQTAGNYTYDEIGNLKTDTKEGITAIDWNVYGKINSITKTGTTINYTYDASGNRISKAVTTGGNTVTTWYARDASGNVMSVYVKGDAAINSGQLTVTETHLYGSSRIGMTTPNLNVQNPVAFASFAVTGFATGYFVNFERGKKFFELTNHLGNVLVTISDKKIGTANGSSVNYYSAEVVSANDYYPFGMQAVGRSLNTSKYRYGFNGKEKDGETYGEGNVYDYGMRILDPRAGRFLSVDPLTRSYPAYTPYAFAMNRPIDGVDLDGAEWTKADLLKIREQATVALKNNIAGAGIVSRGFNNAFVNANSLGISDALPQMLSTDNVNDYTATEDRVAYLIGRVFGDVASFFQAGTEINGGLVVAGTGIGSLAGGAAAAHGALVGLAGTYDLGETIAQLAKYGVVLASANKPTTTDGTDQQANTANGNNDAASNNVQQNNTSNSYLKRTRQQNLDSKKSFEELIAEHKQKIEEFKKDPIGQSGEEWKKVATKDNPSPAELLKRALGRLPALEKQLKKQEGELEKVNEALKNQ